MSKQVYIKVKNITKENYHKAIKAKPDEQKNENKNTK